MPDYVSRLLGSLAAAHSISTQVERKIKHSVQRSTVQRSGIWLVSVKTHLHALLRIHAGASEASMVLLPHMMAQLWQEGWPPGTWRLN